MPAPSTPSGTSICAGRSCCLARWPSWTLAPPGSAASAPFPSVRTSEGSAIRACSPSCTGGVYLRSSAATSSWPRGASWCSLVPTPLACGRRLPPTGMPLPRAPLLRLLEVVEQPRRADARQRFEAVRLPLFHRITGDGAARAQILGLALHLVVPHVVVVLAHVHEHAQLRDRLQPGGGRLPHIAREGGDRQE